MSDRPFMHTESFKVVLTPGSDPRAMGGAVTVALCGHWDHEGPCRWPHHTSVEATDRGRHLVTVRFDASELERKAVSDRINEALQHGAQAGPDGQVSRWTLVATHP